MKLRYSLQARDDLRDIFFYLNDRSSAGAENVMRAIHAGIQFLAENPMASANQCRRDTREDVASVQLQNFYRIDGDAVELIHIRHAARRPFAS